MQSFIAHNNSIEAINTSLDILNQLGIHIPKTPGKWHILLEKIKTKWALRGKTIEDLKDLPQMNDPYKLATMQIMADAFTPLYYTSLALLLIIINKMISLSVKYGNAAPSPFGYVLYGLILCGNPDKIISGYRFGKLAFQVMNKFNTKEMNAKVYCLFSLFIDVWKSHLSQTLEPLIIGYQKGLETGDLEGGCLSLSIHSFHSNFTGRELASSEQMMSRYQDIVESLRQHRHIYAMRMHRQVALNLLGKSPNPCRLVGKVFHEEDMMPLYSKDNDNTSLGVMYAYKVMLSYIFNDYRQAIENAHTTDKYYDAIIGQIAVPIYNFYYSLALLAIFLESHDHKQKEYLKKVASNQKKLKEWAHHAPMNYLHKYYLVEAELARVKGK